MLKSYKQNPIKPGMGHNSLFKIFYEKTNFDYMISLDGDDFLYPYALHQLQKCFTINQHLDVVSIYGNDTLKSFNNSDSQFDIYLTNNFYHRMGYNIPKVFHESTSLKIHSLRYQKKWYNYNHQIYIMH